MELPGVFIENPFRSVVNGSLWTLPIEMILYLMLPVVLIAAVGSRDARRCLFLLMPACSLAVAVSLLLLYRGMVVEQLWVYGVNLRGVVDLAPYFLIGALVAVMGVKAALDLRIAVFGLAVLALLDASPVVAELVLLLVLPYSSLAFALAPMPRMLPVHRFGDLSYGLYLWGFPVQQALVQMGVTTRADGLNYALVMAASLLLAFASWHVVEKRFLRFKPAMPASADLQRVRDR